MKHVEGEAAKPTAVIDMSVLQEICEQKPMLRSELWKELNERYTLVFPFSLVGESCAKWLVAEPDSEAEAKARTIRDLVIDCPHLWLDDIHEIIARECIDRRLPPLVRCNRHVQLAVLALEKGTDGARAWLEKHRSEEESRILERKESKKRVLCQIGEQIRRLQTEQDLFREMLAPFFRELISSGTVKLPLVNHWVGQLLKSRHPELADQFDQAFSELLSARWTQFFLTAGLLQLRYAYLVAPLFVLERPLHGSPGTFARIGLNDRIDEEYILAGFLCQRLLTQDLGMARIMTAFEGGGFWKGKTIYLPKGQWLHEPKRHCV